MGKSRKQRHVIVTETKINCMQHTLGSNLATKILFTMLDNYEQTGTTYLGKELKFTLFGDIPRKYVINLYNDVNKKDTVLITTDDTVKLHKIQQQAEDLDEDCPELVCG